MERRKFVKDCCVLAIGLPVMGTLFGSCTTRHFVLANFSNNRFLVKKTEFEYLKKDKLHFRDAVFIRTDGGFPICLFKMNEDRYIASLMQCTHQSCETQLEGNLFVCPCHGSEFALDGELLKGPADSDLKTYKTETDDENIYIYI